MYIVEYKDFNGDWRLRGKYKTYLKALKRWQQHYHHCSYLQCRIRKEKNIMTRRLIDWFNKRTAVWRGTCSTCGKRYTHRGTEPTQTICTYKDCKGTIIWQIEEV